jgi:hypothetical protein
LLPRSPMARSRSFVIKFETESPYVWQYSKPH